MPRRVIHIYRIVITIVIQIQAGKIVRELNSFFTGKSKSFTLSGVSGILSR